jgi:hypothetical protein
VPVAPQSDVRLSLVARYVVPDLTGRSCAQAQALVSDAGLRCNAGEAGLGNPPSGRIHRQFPAPKTMLSAVKPVQAWEQPRLVVVPNVLASLKPRLPPCWRSATCARCCPVWRERRQARCHPVTAGRCVRAAGSRRYPDARLECAAA